MQLVNTFYDREIKLVDEHTSTMIAICSLARLLSSHHSVVHLRCLVRIIEGQNSPLSICLLRSSPRPRLGRESCPMQWVGTRSAAIGTTSGHRPSSKAKVSADPSYFKKHATRVENSHHARQDDTDHVHKSRRDGNHQKATRNSNPISCGCSGVLD